jgi:hypothetical protein
MIGAPELGVFPHSAYQITVSEFRGHFFSANSTSRCQVSVLVGAAPVGTCTHIAFAFTDARHDN